MSGSDKVVCLHDEVLVSNSDIESAQVVRPAGPSSYGVSIKFTPTGTRKIHAATENHIGKPVAILLDGEVVMAPVVRSPIGASAEITGRFTKTQAEKIARGIETH